GRSRSRSSKSSLRSSRPPERVSGAPLPCFDDLSEDLLERDLDLPSWVVVHQLPQIGDVTNVIATPVLVDVDGLESAPAKLLDEPCRLDQRDAVVATASQVVDLAGSRILVKPVDRAAHIPRVDVVANLLPLVSEDFVRRARPRAL